MSLIPPTDEELQAYADGQLAANRQSELDLYLTEHPTERYKVDAIKCQTRELSIALTGGNPLSSDFCKRAISTARLRIKKRRIKRTALGAVICLFISLGVITGRELRELAIFTQDRPMDDAVLAYRIFVKDIKDPHVDIMSSQLSVMQNWLNRFFEVSPSLPDLAPFSLHLIGGRLMANAQGPAAMVLYATDSGQPVVLYIRYPGARGLLQKGQRSDGELITQYWSEDGFNIGLVIPLSYFLSHLCHNYFSDIAIPSPKG